MKKLILIAIAIIVAIGTYASKVMPGLRSIIQKDGTRLMVRGFGDEHFAYFTTADDVLLYWSDGSYYIAAVDADGMLTSSGVLAHESSLRNAEEMQAIAKQDKQLFMRELDQNVTTAKRKAFGDWSKTKFVPHSGHIRVPIVMVDFPDRKFTFNKEELYDSYMGSHDKADRPQKYKFLTQYGSAKEFFYDSSFGQLDFEFEFYGTYTLPQEHSYYGYSHGIATSLARVIKDALPLIDNDIDFSQYDNDGDGFCDIVYIIYAGVGSNFTGDPSDIWPCCSSVNNLSTNDGVKLSRCGVSNELLVAEGNENVDGKAHMNSVGVFCHEMSHGLGLPDLYYNTTSWETLNNNGPEDWDLMDNGENVRYGYWQPLHSLWERMIFGWIEPTELIEPQDVTVYPLNDEEGRGKAYIIRNPANKDEFWTIENIPSTGWYAGLVGGGTGITIGHVNYSDAKFMNFARPNNVFGKPNCTILPADNFIISSYYIDDEKADGKNLFTTTQYRDNLRGDTYPGSTGTTSLAAYKNYAGEEDLVNTLPITDITLNEDGSVSFRFGHPAPSGIQNAEVSFGNNTIYTLDGRRVNSTEQHGVYIRNGKKYVK